MALDKTKCMSTVAPATDLVQRIHGAYETTDSVALINACNVQQCLSLVIVLAIKNV